MVGRGEGRAGDSETVYLVRGADWSRSFVEPTDETGRRNQMNQLPATRHEVGSGELFTSVVVGGATSSSDDVMIDAVPGD